MKPAKIKASQLQLGEKWGPSLKVTLKDRPFVFLNAAITADGKLAPATRHFEPFSSRRDRLLMYELRSYADAVMSGARTLDLNPVKLGNGGALYSAMRREHGLAAAPIRIVVSGRGSIDPEAEIFKHRFSPIIIMVSESAPKARRKRLQPLADELIVFGETEIDFPAALRWLRSKWGVQRLLCEGGGEVNGGMFAAGVVDEVYLTLCPVVFGGRTAPTLADGRGGERLAAAALLRLRALKRVKDELFLIYRVTKAAAS